MYFFLKYLVTLFYKKLRIKIVVSFLCESGPRFIKSRNISSCVPLYEDYACMVETVRTQEERKTGGGTERETWCTRKRETWW